MSQVFTEYVRSLTASGEPPSSQSFEQVWATLGRALASELKKRGLWETSPRHLGIYGHESWRAVVAGEALEELLAGCYSHIFVRRLGGLKAQLRVKPNIEGLVFLGIRNFLHDTQKRHDPFGFKIFDGLRRALRAALDAGEMFLLSGDRRIRNDTILACDPEAAPDELAGAELEVEVKRWNDTLLPDLVTARGKARERVITVLRVLLAKLPAAGVRAFAFKQLIEPLKNDARARWHALLETEAGPTAVERDGELTTLVRQIQPDTGVEERDAFEQLSYCLAKSLEVIEEPPRTRGYLSTLWEYLRAFAAGADGGMPSARKLARHLGIPRDRLPGLFTTLGRLVETCRAANSRKRPVNSMTEDRHGSTAGSGRSQWPKRHASNGRRAS